MEMLRAALLGCLLTGGVLFGARPPAPERRLLRETARAAGPGHLGLSAEEMARWVRPLPAPVTLADLRATPIANSIALGQTDPPVGHARRRRCNEGRVRRRTRL